MNTLFYILTRSGNREECFLNLKKSLEKQTYKKYIHLISNDNPKNTFLKNEKNVIQLYHLKKRKRNVRHCPYNIYLNELIKEIKDDEGWVLIMDDDSKFIRDNYLEQLAKICKKNSENHILILNTFLGKYKIKFPSSNELKFQTIDMSNICIHSSVLKRFRFSDECGGDFRLIEKLKKKEYYFKFIKLLSIGIWANYYGSLGGRNP